MNVKTAALSLLVAVQAAATPVLFKVNDNQGGASQAKLTIHPQNNPLLFSTNIVAGRDVVTNLSSGQRIVELVPNDYRVTIEGVPASFLISVPDTNVVMNATDLPSQGLKTYIYTNSPVGVSLAVFQSATNGLIPKLDGFGTNTAFDLTGNHYARFRVGPVGNPIDVDFKTAASQDHLRIYMNSGASWYDFNSSELAYGSVTNSNTKIWKISGLGSLGQNVFQGSLQADSFTGDASGLTNLVGDASRLTNLFGVSPFAQAYAISNSVTGSGEISDLNLYFADLQSSATLTNLVDTLALSSRFNATNKHTLRNYSFAGTVTNTPDGIGCIINPTNTLSYTLPTTLTNFTIVFTVEDLLVGGWSISLYNSSTKSAVYANQLYSGLIHVWERDKGVIPYNADYTDLRNLVMPLWLREYTSDVSNQRIHERHVYALSRGSDNAIRFYEDGVLAKINNSSPAFTYTSPSPTTDAFDTLGIGVDATNNNNAASGYLTNAVISSVQVLNTTNLQAIRNAIRAARSLEPEDHDDIWIGDSLMAINTLGTPANTNNYISYFYEGRTKNRATRNYAESGAYAGNDFATTWLPGGGAATVTNFNPAKVKYVNLFFGLGVNDIYGGAVSGTTLYNTVTNNLAQFQANSAVRIWLLNVQAVSTNGLTAYTYNTTREADINLYNTLIATNYTFQFYRVIDRHTYASQYMLNQQNGYSEDGLHFRVNPYYNQQLADVLLGGKFVDPSPAPTDHTLSQSRSSLDVSNATYGLDFNSTKLVEINAAASALSFYATNNVFTNGAFQERSFIIRAGLFTPTLTFPTGATGWTWLTNGTTPPAALTAGTLLRLKLTSVPTGPVPGTGQTNIIAEGWIGTDNSFYIDTDAASYFSRAGISDTLHKTVVNSFVKDLKAGGVWDSFTNGFCYVFYGGVTNNIMSASYSLTNHGTFTNNNRGFNSDGSSGYYDTGFIPNSVASLDATNMTLYTYIATNANTASFTRPIGSRNSVEFDMYWQAPVFWNMAGFNDVGGNTPSAAVSTGAIAGDPANVALIRTDSSTRQLYIGGYVQAATATSTTKDDVRTLIGAVNNGSGLSPALFYNGEIKIVMCGRGLARAQVQILFAAATKLNTTFSRAGNGP